MSALASQEVLPDLEARVAADVHTGDIHQIRLSRDGQRLVSIGHDKFLLVWRAADLRLMRRVVLPSGRGHAGVLRALALTPDGQRAFVGGVVSPDPQAEGEVYEVDLQKGELLSRIRLPSAAESMDIDASGQRLAVGLHRGGVQVLDVQTRAKRFADDAYDATVKFVHFAPDSRLATTADDGMVRMYDDQGKLAWWKRFVETQPGGGCQARSMGGGRFSPDGRYFAFGYQDCPQTVVLDFQASKVIAVPRGESSPDSLCCISWSPDSQRLYTYGRHAPGKQAMLYVSKAVDGFQAVQSLKVQARSFSNSIPLADGGLFVATQDPGILRLRPDGSVALAVKNQAMPTEFKQGLFYTNHEGTSVTLPDAQGGWVSFDVSAPPSVGLTVDPSFKFKDSFNGVRHGQGLRFEWRHSGTHAQALLVNGVAVGLGRNEQVRAHAEHPQGQAYYLGGNWRVAKVGADGQVQAVADTTSPARHLTVSGNGRWLIAMLGDGTVRWYDAQTLGQPVLSLYAEPQRGEWVAWTQEGHYSASRHGDEFLGWHVPGLSGSAPRFLHASQFLNELYRPDLIAKALDASSVQSKALNNVAQRLNALSAPRVRVSVSRDGQGAATIRWSAQATGRPLSTATVYVDDVPVLQSDLGQQQAVQRELALPDGFSGDSVRVEVSTDASLGFDDWLPTQPRSLTAHQNQGRLFVVAMGVNDFAECRQGALCQGEPRHLTNAPADAEALTQALVAGSTGVFSEVASVQLLIPGSPTPPTKGHLIAAMAKLKDAGPLDTVVFFVAAHGVEARSGRRYWFVGEDARMADIKAILQGAETASSLVSSDEIQALLDKVPGRRLVVLDTCHAGAVGAKSDHFSVAKRSAARRIAFLAASQGGQSSYEHIDEGNVKHGAFTHYLLEALRSARDTNGAITLLSAFEHLQPRVADMSRKFGKGNVILQSPVLFAPPVLRQMPLIRRQGM
ncbi:caspase family protein [Aquabacterium lacunae]|uniref:caspase family protein n=1 Tax=Aquabacterium lacunae TaxID=2528630 RepID=UPI0013EF1163|nr:caspase family protein [Aquabacterium lacunae]